MRRPRALKPTLSQSRPQQGCQATLGRLSKELCAPAKEPGARHADHAPTGTDQATWLAGGSPPAASRICLLHVCAGLHACFCLLSSCSSRHPMPTAHSPAPSCPAPKAGRSSCPCATAGRHLAQCPKLGGILPNAQMPTAGAASSPAPNLGRLSCPMPLAGRHRAGVISPPFLSLGVPHVQWSQM